MKIFNQRIAELIIRQLRQQQLTAAEQLELQEWINDSNDNRNTYDRLVTATSFDEDLHEYGELRDTIRQKIDAKLNTDTLTIKRSRITWYIAAAAVLIVAFLLSYGWLASLFHTPSKARPAATPLVAQDVAPGGDKATLTLGNGSTITLQDAADGALAMQGDAHISKAKNQLSYSSSSASSEIFYNTLTTPRAGQFSLVLPDGSKVWLNNATTLRYPTNFIGTSREVELIGEAYFEIAKNTKPFKVKVKNIYVNVLGTNFNIMAYADENTVKTTLLNGSIKLRSADAEVMLTPDQQAEFTVDGKWNVSSVEAENSIAWKKGFFHFDHADIRTVMHQLARWYNIDVEYVGVTAQHLYGGNIQRDLKLSEVLENLEKNDVHFTVRGNKIIVTR